MLVPLSFEQAKTYKLTDVLLSKSMSGFGITVLLTKMRSGEVILSTGKYSFLVVADKD